MITVKTKITDIIISIHPSCGRERKKTSGISNIIFWKAHFEDLPNLPVEFQISFFRKPQFEDLPNLPVRMPFFDVGGVHTTTREVA